MNHLAAYKDRHKKNYIIFLSHSKETIEAIYIWYGEKIMNLVQEDSLLVYHFPLFIDISLFKRDY